MGPKQDQDGLEGMLFALAWLVVTVSEQDPRSRRFSRLGGEQANHTLKGHKSAGLRKDLEFARLYVGVRCYESCTRTEELRVIRNIKVVVLQPENVRSTPRTFITVPSPTVSQRLPSKKMNITTTQNWKVKLEFG